MSGKRKEDVKVRISNGKIDSTRRLITMIEDSPCLWDKWHSDYRDKFQKDQAWLEIYKQFEPSYETLKPSTKKQIETTIMKKWYNIRDAYVKSKRLIGYGRNKPYIYSEYLKFLDSVTNVDSNTSTFVGVQEKIECNDQENPLETENACENWLEDMSELNEAYDNTDEQSLCKKPKLEFEYRNPIESEDNIVAVLSNLLQKEEDEDRAFFKSITPSVKKLTESSKLEFRIQVMKLIKELRIKDKNRKKSDGDSES